MPAAPLTIVPFDADLAAFLARLPGAPGVGQILGPDGSNLVIGRTSSVRRWAASHLGAGPRRPGQRPPTDLRSLATAVGYAPTTSAFHQRLRYERLMAIHVPPAARRDLKPPAFLHLDPEVRFPRVTIRDAEAGGRALFGPFRNRRAAERTRAALHKVHPLRPCDYTFEPDPVLPLGLGCLYAQVRSCAAPCLARVSEEAYRRLAGEAAALLAQPWLRPPEFAAWLPPWVSAAPARGLVVVAGTAGIELHPLQAGRVLDELSLTTTREDLEASLDRLRWEPPATPGLDWPWLSAWLASPRGRGSYVPVPDGPDASLLLAGIRAALNVDVAATRAR
ncbi:MAG TPA: hypothetical protein VN461_06355 [Vicinamibacteria bacterium]|nr:hypothetical protein [Vicinamibacteria bacterium]